MSSTSYGKCEGCGKQASCTDVHIHKPALTIADRRQQDEETGAVTIDLRKIRNSRNENY
jgi:hypothetical protein